MNLPYNSYSEYLQSIFDAKTYKISLDAGFGCPNKSDRIGCTYCNETSFSPSKQHIFESLKEQIDGGIRGLRRRYKKAEKFLGYLQPNTNTIGSVDYLYKLYKYILEQEHIEGLIIGTRPDCIDKDKIDMIDELAKDYYISIEYGLQSANNKTLKNINRGHTVEDFVSAMNLTCNRNIDVGVHVILGLPNESMEDFLKTTNLLNSFKYQILKIHNLHIVKNSQMERDYLDGKIKLMSMEEYAEVLVNFVGHIREDVVIARVVGDAPKNYLVAPNWVLEKAKATQYIHNLFEKKGIYQSSLLYND